MELLFERLTRRPGNQPQSSAQGMTQQNMAQQNMTQLQQSVIAEISRILSARSYFHGDESQQQDVLSYGIPRLADYSTFNNDDMSKLRSNIEKSIRHFEPRLQQLTVSVEKSNRAEEPLSLNISGILQLKGQQDHVAFTMMPTLSLTQ